jgi:hypothetical protein
LKPRPRWRVLATCAVEEKPNPRGAGMAARTAKICRRCHHLMVTVTNMAPNGRDPGLVAWYCEYCGAADSDLIYPTLSERLA